MTRITPSAAKLILQEEQAFARYRQTLKPDDQPLLDEQLYELRLATIHSQDDGDTPSFEGVLLERLFFNYKAVKKLYKMVVALRENAKATPLMPREAPLSRSKPVDPGIGFDDDPKI